MKRFIFLAPLLVGLLLACAVASCDDESRDEALAESDDDAGPAWYKNVVFMEIFLRSYYDSDGDGIGDLRGLTSKLPYIADLGIGAIWLTPIFPTPFHDSGYDVADYTDINPDYGTMGYFLAFLHKAHELGIRVFLDGVFNHTSFQHPWFEQSRSSKNDPKRDWYIWADQPYFSCPNPLPPGMLRPQWTFDEATGQYYYHHFLSEMPDLNHANPEVREAIKDVLRFWLDLGVDGFRLDVAHLYFEDEGVCGHHPQTHLFLKEMRSVLDEYDDRAMVGEVSGLPGDVIEYLGDGNDELHMILDFGLAAAVYASLFFQRPLFTEIMMDLTYERFPAGGQGAVFLSNHDFFRDSDLHLHNKSRCKLASALQLTLPGTPFIYYGQEVGMAGGTQIVVDYRDTARTPMHWNGSENAGFTSGVPWIAVAPNYRENNVEDEQADPDSLFSHYRRMIRLRNETKALFAGDFATVGIDSTSAYAFFRWAGDDSVLVILNFSDHLVDLSLNLGRSPWEDLVGRVRDEYSGDDFPDLTAENAAAYPIALPGLGFVLLRLEPDEADGPGEV